MQLLKCCRAQAVAAVLPAELAGPALRSALEAALLPQLRRSFREPLMEGLRAGLVDTLLPAFERASQAMFAQVGRCKASLVGTT